MKRLMNIIHRPHSAVIMDQAVFSGTSFLVTLMLARKLGPSEFGVFTSVVLFIYLLMSVANALIIQPFQVNYNEKTTGGQHISFLFFAQTFMILFIALVAWTFLSLPIKALDSLKPYTGQILLYVSLFIFHDFFRKFFLSVGRVHAALGIDSIQGLLQAGILIYTYLNWDIGVSEAIFLVGISYIPSVLVSILLMKPKPFAPLKGLPFLKMHLQQGSWLLMTGVLQWWANNLFVVASGVFLGAKALGAFRLVQSMFGVLGILFQTFENYALPQAAQLFSRSRSASVEYLKRINIRGALGIGLLLSCLFLFADQVILLAGGEQYREYAFLVKGMSILYFVIFLGYPIRMAIRMMILNRSFFMGYVLSFLFSLLTFKYLLIEFNLTGAVAGLVINQLIMLTFWQYTLIKNEFILWK